MIGAFQNVGRKSEAPSGNLSMQHPLTSECFVGLYDSFEAFERSRLMAFLLSGLLLIVTKKRLVFLLPLLSIEAVVWLFSHTSVIFAL